MKAKQLIRKIMIICIWVGIWEMLALSIHSGLIMAGPVKTMSALAGMAVSAQFYECILFSVCRILTGFFIALLGAVLLAALSFRFSFIREFLHPFFLLVRSIPVASFIIIALLWMGSKNLAVFIAVLIALPVLYSQLLTGLQTVDQKYKELAEAFRFKCWTKICTIYVPAVRESFLAACRLAVGMSFKAGIAAEVIAGTGGSIGERLYLAKLYFSTGELFAWTAVIVILSFICEKLVEWAIGLFISLLMAECISLGLMPTGRGEKETQKGTLTLELVSKSFGDHEVFSDISVQADAPAVVAVTGVSGIGKSTLLKMIEGFEQPDTGSITRPEKMSVMFQDTRLIEHQSAVANVLYAMYGKNSSAGSKAEIRKRAEEALQKVLPPECVNRKVSTLSGGQRRRVELVRALISDAELVLLDEPFTGLDEETKELCACFVREYAEEKILVIAVHEIDTIGNMGLTARLILE